MSAPPVPPRPPLDAHRNPSLPPPVPPLPPDFRPSPLPAPIPHRFDPNIAISLDRQASPGPAPLPTWQPWNPGHPPTPPSLVPPAPSTQSLTTSPSATMPFPADYSDSLPPFLPFPNPQRRTPSSPSYPSQQSQSSPQRPLGPPSLISPLPSVQSLTAALPTIQQPSHDPALKIAWCRDIFFLIDRLQQNSGPDRPIGPAYIPEPQLARLVQVAVPIVLQIANTQPVSNLHPRFIAEAVYFRATFTASGAYPDFVQHNPRQAFRDFEQAARAGYAAAWFKLGREYENFSDIAHARDCFERGIKLGVESCIYRMGMAHLMGQLGLPPSPEQAVPLLHRAATLASLDVPQPSYVYGLLLLGEFSHVTIPPEHFNAFIPPGSNSVQESRKYLERAAFLNFAPAQYKLGHSYEFAQPPFPFDPLLSVQYYSLASQQGEIEADMALSKWFLCGAEGAFEKDESLAFVFAEKAARKGLPSAEFAMGYYAEVGVGCPKDLDVARKWYIKASEEGNTDAIDRLRALNQAHAQPLSRQEHNTITQDKLIRKRTQAKQRSDASVTKGTARRGPDTNPSDGSRIVEVIRKNSLTMYNTHQPDHHLYQTQRLPTMPEHLTPSDTQPAHARKSSAPDAALPIKSPRPRPAQPNLGRQNQTQDRYSLTDAALQQQQLQQSANQLTLSPSPGSVTQEINAKPTTHRPTGKGPTTFAEMGFQSGKADEKDCTIM